jgi:sensor histidine kinase regulating citrate/malate metabolism
MIALAKIGKWVSKGRWHLYPLFMLLMVLPIAFFAYSVGQVLRHQTETVAVTESAQIARASAILVEQHCRHSTAFLESIATHPSFRQAWAKRDLKILEWNLSQSHSLRPDFAFVSVYELDGTMRAIYPPQTTLLKQNFSYRDWYQGTAARWKPYISEVYQTAVGSHQLVVAIVVPVTDQAGKPIGILMAPCTLDTMSRQLVETRLDGGWDLAGRPERASIGPPQHRFLCSSGRLKRL